MSAEPTPALDVQVYREVAALLGGDKARELVLKLEARLHRSLAIQNPAAVDPVELAREAHVLVSQAGALGFLELGELCRDLEAACLARHDLSGLLHRAQGVRDRAIEEIARLNSARESAA